MKKAPVFLFSLTVAMLARAWAADAGGLTVEVIPHDIAASTYDPARDLTWVAKYDGKIYATKDGRNFQLGATLPKRHVIFRIFVTSKGAIYVSGPSCVYRSDNDGTSFTRVDGTGGLPADRGMWGGICETANGHLLLGLYGRGLMKGIYKSTDEGKTWANVFDPAAFWKGKYDFFHVHNLWYDKQTDYVYATYGDGPPGVNGPEGVMRSEDAGVTWKVIHDTCGKWRYTAVFRFHDYIYLFDDSTRTRSMRPRPPIVERFRDHGADTVDVEFVYQPNDYIGDVVHPTGATVLQDTILYGTLVTAVSRKAQICSSKDGTNWEIIYEIPCRKASGFYGFERFTQELDEDPKKNPNAFVLVGLRGEEYALRIGLERSK